jgi:hypothetical protein
MLKLIFHNVCTQKGQALVFLKQPVIQISALYMYNNQSILFLFINRESTRATYRTTKLWLNNRARICKRLRNPEIDSKESIRQPLLPGGTVRQIRLSYWPARLGIDSWAP